MISSWTKMALTALTLGVALAAFAFDGDTEELHLSDLEDGETRIFGEGEHEISATRDGDVVTVSMPGVDDEAMHEISVDLSEDDGHIVVLEGEHKNAIWVKAGGELGEDEMDIEILDLEDGEPGEANVFIRKMIEVAEGDEELESRTMRIMCVGAGEGEGKAVEIDVQGLIDEHGEHADVQIMKISTEECEEGEKVMVRIEVEEEEDE